MAFKIKIEDQKRITGALDALAAERDELEEAVIAFNEALAEARAMLQQRLDAYNEKAEAVRAMVQDVHRELEDEYDNRSDNWRDGDKGQAVKEWIDTVEAFPEQVMDASIDEFPETLEFEAVIGDDPADDFNELDKEPGP